MAAKKIAKKPARRPSLPRLPSKLIRVALADLIKAEQSPKHTVEMRRWHRPSVYQGPTTFNSTCDVCFAGSVMAFTLKTNPRHRKSHASFGELNRKKFLFLNDVRCGDVNISHLVPGRRDFKMQVTEYRTNPAAFKRDIGRVIAKLEARGL